MRGWESASVESEREVSMAGRRLRRLSSLGVAPWLALSTALLFAVSPMDGVHGAPRIPAETVKLWASAFGGEIKSISSRYSGSQFLQKKYKESEKRVRIDEVDGLQLVKKIAKNMETMFSKKVTAVKRLVEAAEEANMNHTFDENLEYPYYTALSMQDERDNYGLELGLEPNEHYNNMSVNTSLSGVQVPTNVYNKDPAVINGALWSSALNAVFVNNSRRDPTLTWQYFGSVDGFFRQYPGVKWEADENSEGGVIEYDCRNRGWFIQASTSPKDVVILVDVSGSMKGLRMTIAKRTVISILETLGDNDFFNIIGYNDFLHYVEPCLNETLVQADRDNREHFKKQTEKLLAKGTGLLENALDRAFSILNEFNRTGQGSQCSQAIMLITDGATDTYDNVFNTYNRPHRRVRLFTYLIGREVAFADSVKWMACSNKGYYSRISTLANVPENVMHYLPVLSRPMAISRGHTVIWTEAYTDYTLPQAQKLLTLASQDHFLKTSVAMPVFSGKSDMKSRGVLLGVVGLDVPLKDILRVVPRYKLGEHGYAFAITNNGYILSHPDQRPLYREGGKFKAKPHSVDLLEVEWGEQDDVLRAAMVNRQTGSYSSNIRMNVPISEERVLPLTKEFYYTDIKNTPFSLGIVVGGSYGKFIFSANVSLAEALEDLAHPDVMLSNEWTYCHTEEDPHLHKVSQLESVQRYLSGEKLGLRCNNELIRQVMFDAVVSAPLEAYWTNLMLNKSQNLELGVEQAFLGTRSGLLRKAEFLGSEKITDRDFLTDDQKDTLFTVERFPLWFRRASALPPGNFIYSVPFKAGTTNRSTVVTASTAITVSANRRMATAAVVGIQMKLDYFQQKFWTATKQRDDADCTTVDGKCPISMDDENLRCYLIDNNGYIMVSKSYEETGRFLGEVDGTVMKKLLTMGIFQRVTLYDFQAMCRLVPDSHSSRAGLSVPTPYQSLSALVKWLITELAMLVLEFNLSGLWRPEHAATAQKVRRQDLLQPCHKQYPAFSAAPTLKENSGVIDCGDCERMFVIQQVPGSNLLLLVVDTECRCDNMFRMGLHPVEIKQNESSRCERLRSQKLRRRPDQCYAFHSEEDAAECGGAARPGVWASTLLTTLALTSTALHAVG
uniref:Voltage-dependent calcium channel subunit alpha-2/delta-3-like isoform X1 n=1 Tax=Petromyzon marinus TaxID=7757 RepID=A0AAJ7U212_PETMA|nr:voltage-dependent calcium channel subunit alpha-2/delta-3-like isoform X1 [Petromyzon marinus]